RRHTRFSRDWSSDVCSSDLNRTWAEPVPGPIPAPDEAIRLQTGSHADPHSLLGAHPDSRGVVVRAYHPDALDCTLVLGGTMRPKIGRASCRAGGEGSGVAAE